MSNRCKVSSPRRAATLVLGVALALAGGCGDDGDVASTTTTDPGTTSVTDVTGTSATGEPVTTGLSTSGMTGTSGITGTSGMTTSGVTTSGTGEHTTGTGDTGADACADSVLTWENFGEPFMLSWCTGCHHSALVAKDRACAPCAVNFDQHAGVHLQAPNIELRVLDWIDHMGIPPMPPAAIVPDDQRALLREYLDCGAPGPEAGAPAPACPDPGTDVPACK